MKREDIENAAINYDSRLVAFRAFMKGADWRINTAWHDANEIPKKNDSYIVVYNRFGIKTDFWSHYRGWEKYRRVDKVKKWAYIEDLLPTEEGEQ